MLPRRVGRQSPGRGRPVGNPDALGQAVKKFRVECWLTQGQVSAVSGLYPTDISDIERGVRNPSFEAITRLADGIGVTVADIGRGFDDQDEPPAA